MVVIYTNARVFWYNGSNCGSTSCINHTHVQMWDSPGAGLCDHATFGSVKGDPKVIARSKLHKFKLKKNYTSQAILSTSG